MATKGKAYREKAYREGANDAQTWMSENPKSTWADTIRAGAGSPSDALINAIDSRQLAHVLGVANVYGKHGMTKRAFDALRSYDEGWRDEVEQACLAHVEQAAKKPPAQLQREIDKVVGSHRR